MKNLKVYSELTSQIELQSKDEVLLFSSFDIERNRMFFASSANVVYTIQLPLSHEKEGTYGVSPLCVETEPMDLEPGDCITAIDYVMEKEALIVGTMSGYLLLYIKEDNLTDVVGRVEGGVKSISPSPDGALLAVITGLGQILVMTHDWEVLYETALENISIDNDNAVAGEPTAHQSPVSWRGDGKYFATLTDVDNSSPKRIKIWERESGVLHASSEPKIFMGAAMDWMPSGAKIAAACSSKADKKSPLIVFFERNGLERSSFSVDGPMDGIVEMLKWNCNSDILAAVVRYEGYDAIKIWTFSNNHWYLKQEMRYLKKDGVKFMWDPTKSLHLICWTLGGNITTYNFVLATAVMEDSTAFVIDNTNILVSPLSLALMPPPMCLFSLSFPSAVRDMTFLHKDSKNLLAACLSDGSLCVAELPSIDSWEELEGKEISIEAVCSEMNFWSFRHLTWLDSHILIGVSCREPSVEQGTNKSLGLFLQEIEIVCSEGRVPGSVTSSGWSAKISNGLSLERPVTAIIPNPAKHCSAFIQTDGGRVVEYTSKLLNTTGIAEQCIQKLDYDIGFSSSCPWMYAVAINDNGVLKPLLLGLDSSSRLHAKGRIICYNCSSLSSYSNTSDHTMTHLILTTKQDLLFVIDAEDLLQDDLDAKYGSFVRGTNKKQENKDAINIWERGAKLVGVLHGDEAAAILQTNRGNLECVYPRKLVLQSIINALVQGRFKDALFMVRRHRIDFNVIIDHCGWMAFLQSAKDFVRQVNNLSYITEFVCSIKNENVMETLYKNIATLRDTQGTLFSEVKGSDEISKVSSVLLAIRKALEEEVEENPARELCILTTLARSEPPALEEALKRIKVIRDMELLAVHDPRRKAFPSAEEALKHLLWLSDSEAVYDTALGLYDLNLAAIVALNSQKDPKEFLPFLQGLERMPTVIMQYTIDLRLQKFESALKNLFLGGDAYYEDSMNLMKSNPELFPLGLQLFTNPSKRNQLLEAWGDHLHGEKSFEDAAATYLCCSSLQKALKTYRDCGNWKGVLTIAGQLKLKKQEVLQLANELCEELQALGKPGEAGEIALEYIGDVAIGIRCFISAREWEEAMRVGLMHERDDLILEVNTAAVECANTLIGEYREGLEKIGKYLTRYLAVRQRRLVLAAKLQSEDKLIGDVDEDVASETSSCFSGMSAYTTGTRKSSVSSMSSSATSKGRDKRRQRHRGGKIRAGSAGEEMALVEHLKGMSLTSSARRELKSLLLTLLMLNNEELARKLQHAGDTYQVAQMAAVKLAEDTVSSENIDEKTQRLEHYLQKYGAELHRSDVFSWQPKVLLPPSWTELILRELKARPSYYADNRRARKLISVVNTYDINHV